MGKNIKTHTVKELLALSAPALSDLWLVEGLIPKNNISALVGPSDCGKSTWARQLALCVADNKPDFLGLPLYGVNNTVCYISTEDDEATTRAVLNKQNQGLQIKGGLDKLSFAFDNEDIGEKLEHLLSTEKYDLIVIDGWADTFNGNLNSVGDVRSNLKVLSQLANRHNCAILLLHHNVKHSEASGPDKNKVNGSQSFEAKMRAVIELRNGTGDSERLLTVVKANGLSRKEKEKTRVLELDDTHLIFNHRSEVCKGASSKTSYDAEFWLPQMAKSRRLGKSYEAAIKDLAHKYPGKKVPSKGWFVENMKKLGSQNPNNLGDCPNETESVTIKNDHDGEY